MKTFVRTVVNAGTPPATKASMAPTIRARPARPEQGSALVLVVLTMLVVLLMGALAVDHGILVLEANRVQRACDAAALAAAIHLSGLQQAPTSQDLAAARAQAISTAGANKVAITASIQPQGRIFRDTLGSRFDSGDRSFEVFLLNPKDQTNGNSPHPIQDVARIEIVERSTMQGRNGARMGIRFFPPSGIDTSNRDVVIAQPGESAFSASILRLVDDL